MRIDAHQHFWIFDPVRDSWISDEMHVIKRDFLPHDLEPHLLFNSIDGCVAVQADQSETETLFLLDLAKKNQMIKGVVGWVDLFSPGIVERLEHYKQFETLKGFRHVLQGDPRRDLMLSPEFTRGIKALAKYGYTYDILIFPDQLIYAEKLVAQFPDQLFVLDHIAKPNVKDRRDDGWHAGIRALAKHENVYCKVSGMVTEADWHHWQVDDFKQYIDTILESFGTKRIMFGSDWPVCQLAADYNRVVQLAHHYVSGFSIDEHEQFFGSNATWFYGLK